MRRRRDPRKVIVTVAPVAPVDAGAPSGTRNPRAPEEIAAQVIECARVGASMVHLHVRDLQGEQTSDLAVFSRTLDLIRAGSDIVIQASTGGLSMLGPRERCVALQEPRVEAASLNMGSVNIDDAVYLNALPDIRFWAAEARRHRVATELEIFDLGMLATADSLVREGLLEPPLNYNFCLGFRGALPAEPRHLAYLAGLLPPGSHWGVVHAGMEDFRLLACALGLGARSIRVGYEDGWYLAPGVPAASNAALVERAVSLVRLLGLEVATAAEARVMLGLRRTVASSVPSLQGPRPSV